MQVQFVKLSPAQNVTILVKDPVPREDQPKIAAGLLSYDSVGGEQVGFLEESDHGARMRLQMMGGEFCGNATMSLGAYLARMDALKDGEAKDYRLEVSGAQDLVSCRIEKRGEDYLGTVDMPLPEDFGRVCIPTDHGDQTFPMVTLPGISHIIVPADADLTASEIEHRIRSWNGIIRADALGAMLYDESTGNMRPIVYVAATDSAVWERGCGSGTAALGCWKALTAGQDCDAVIRQPGGEIAVHAELRENRVQKLTIAGTVRITCEGTAYL